MLIVPKNIMVIPNNGILNENNWTVFVQLYPDMVDL